MGRDIRAILWVALLRIIFPVRIADVDVLVVQVELRVHVAQDRSIRANDLLQLNLDEVIEGADVLLHKALDLQEGGKQVPFVSCGIDRICQGFAVVEGFEYSVEAIVPVATFLVFLRGSRWFCILLLYVVGQRRGDGLLLLLRLLLCLCLFLSRLLRRGALSLCGLLLLGKNESVAAQEMVGRTYCLYLLVNSICSLKRSVRPSASGHVSVL